MMTHDREFAGIDWGLLPPAHLPSDMTELVDGWIANSLADDRNDTHFWAWQVSAHLSEAYPDLALAFIVITLDRPVLDHVRALLAAGPLEDLLSFHGPAVIADVERLARQSAVFRSTLQGVWRFTMSDEIWERVVAARGTAYSP